MRATAGTASHVHEVAPAWIVESLGKYLVVLVDGLKERNAGPVVLVVDGIVELDVPLSICSQS